MERLYLHTPVFSELWYRQKLLPDPDTMNYNKGVDGDGCIDFPVDKWDNWYRYWLNMMPVRYYAYITKLSDGLFIGEVNLHKNNNVDPYEDYYDMGIIIENKFRCNGYGREALELLLNVAFCELGASTVHNSFECYRVDALKIHLYAGFKVDSEKDHIYNVSIAKSDYFGNRR